MKIKKIIKPKDKKEISRKDAIKKLGTYAAVTALGTMMILSPKKAQAGSPTIPGW